MKVTTFEKWLVRRWTKAGLLYRPVAGGLDMPSQPAYVGALGVYETLPLPLPQTGTKVLFSLQNTTGSPFGGCCRIVDIFGVVTTAIGAVANATKLQVIATDQGGVLLTAVDLCATLDINALAKGNILNITGTLANAMTNNANGVAIAMVTPIHFTFGSTATIVLNCAGSDGLVGFIKWFCICQIDYGSRCIPQVS